MPVFLLLALIFPSLLYAALPWGRSPAHDTYGELSWLANDASLAAIVPGLLAFAISVAFERNSGFMDYRRALPAPRLGYLGAKVALYMLVTLLSVMLLLLVVWLTGRAMPSASGAMLLVLVELFGTLPFCTLGLLIGSFADGRRVIGPVNLLLLPLALASGLLVPLQVLPQALRNIAILSPGYDLLAMALAAITPGFTESPLHALFLALLTIIMGTLAHWRLR